MANDTTGVDLGDLRKHGQKLLFAFRTGWLDMANFLKDVEKNKHWKEWKFKSFREFYLDEYKLSDAEVKLLRVGIDTVTRFAPQLRVLDQNPAARTYNSNDVPNGSSMIADMPDHEACVRNVEKTTVGVCRDALSNILCTHE